VIIRPERAADAAAIRDVLIAAFHGNAEASLVERLRRDGDLVLALVAEHDGALRGYVAFPRLGVEHEAGRHTVVGLAPVGVAPECQGRGIGSALILEGHRRLAAQGEPLVFVLGHAAYYPRFGYSHDVAAPFESAYAGPHFMALRLGKNAPRSGKVGYPAAFDQLG
jgi:putative acetyltransferase